jgi:hypothetical protein
MIHRVKKGTKQGLKKARRAAPSALDKLRKTPGFREEMLDQARKDQNSDIPFAPMGIVDSVMKQIEKAKPKPARLMKRNRSKG